MVPAFEKPKADDRKKMFSNLEPMPDMTPTAVKLYQFSKSRPLPATVGTLDFQRLCGIDAATPGWLQEVERVCRELVSASVVKSAYVHDGVIHLG